MCKRSYQRRYNPTLFSFHDYPDTLTSEPPTHNVPIDTLVNYETTTHRNQTIKLIKKTRTTTTAQNKPSPRLDQNLDQKNDFEKSIFQEPS
jgi:hypothetical protein